MKFEDLQNSLKYGAVRAAGPDGISGQVLMFYANQP